MGVTLSPDILNYTGVRRKDVYLIKTDANGDTVKTNSNKVFVKTFGGHTDDEGYSVQQTTDGGYIITGIEGGTAAGGEDVYLVKTDADGDTVFTKTFGGDCPDVGLAVQQTRDGGYIITGFSHNRKCCGRGCISYKDRCQRQERI